MGTVGRNYLVVFEPFVYSTIELAQSKIDEPIKSDSEPVYHYYPEENIS